MNSSTLCRTRMLQPPAVQDDAQETRAVMEEAVRMQTGPGAEMLTLRIEERVRQVVQACGARWGLANNIQMER